MKPAELVRSFEDLFGSPPRIFRAPGRVNLLGEHTDYNEGFVMPCAIGFSTRVAISSRPDRTLLIRSEAFSEQFEFSLDNLPSHGKGLWSDYVLGIVVMLRQMGVSTRGANLLVRGEVPIGAGLSSSAAIEVASALALLSLDGVQLPLPEVAKVCQRTENLFVGARVGIMDQFVSCLGKAGHALMLDCRSLEFTLIPIPGHLQLVICNTMVKHDHASGAYNRRREECDEGVKILSKWYPDICALRDISIAQLQEHMSEIPAIIYKRCLHVVSENDRVLAGAKYLSDGDVNQFGRLMLESHRSLADLFEVSCRELDIMVEIAQTLEGYVGGRMTGGGFGGCTVNLVKSEAAERFADEMSKRYQSTTGILPDIYICLPANGAGPE